mgnify:FL=1
MARVERFEDLEVWKLARGLAKSVYSFAKSGDFSRDFGLRDQICRAAVSVVSNIAEGFDRKSTVQFLQFLEIASGSASEVKAQLYVALDVGYITQSEFDAAYGDATRVGQMLTKLMQYLRTRPNRPSILKEKKQ